MPKPVRPALVTVAAVLNIATGILAILCGGSCGLLVAWTFSMIRSVPARPGEPHPKEVFDIIGRHFPYYEEIMVASFLIAGLLGLFLIISGIGTLLVKQWGRILTILTGLAIIAHSVFLAGYYIAVVIPNQSKMQQEFIDYAKKIEEDAKKKQAKAPPGSPPPPAFATPAPANQSANHLLYLGCFVVCLAYGTAIVLVMVLPSTRKAFEESANYVEDDDDEWKHERRRRLLEVDDFDRPRFRDDDIER